MSIRFVHLEILFCTSPGYKPVLENLTFKSVSQLKSENMDFSLQFFQNDPRLRTWLILCLRKLSDIPRHFLSFQTFLKQLKMFQNRIFHFENVIFAYKTFEKFQILPFFFPRCSNRNWSRVLFKYFQKLFYVKVYFIVNRKCIYSYIILSPTYVEIK